VAGLVCLKFFPFLFSYGQSQANLPFLLNTSAVYRQMLRSDSLLFHQVKILENFTGKLIKELNPMSKEIGCGVMSGLK